MKLTLGIIIAALILAATAAAGGFNWKKNVQTDCHRLAVNARWVYNARNDGQTLKHRIERLSRTSRACQSALNQIPGE